MQNGEIANVRYEIAPKKGNLMYDSLACLNHLHGKEKDVETGRGKKN